MSLVETPLISVLGQAFREVPRDSAIVTISIDVRNPVVDDVRKQGKELTVQVQEWIKTLMAKHGVTLTERTRRDTPPTIQAVQTYDRQRSESKHDGYQYAWGTRLQVPAAVAGPFIDEFAKEFPEGKSVTIRGAYVLSDSLRRETSKSLYAEAFADARALLNERATIVGFLMDTLEILSIKSSDEPSDESGQRSGHPMHMMAMAASEAGGGGSNEPTLQLEPGTERVTFTVYVKCRGRETVRIKAPNTP